MWRRSTRKLPSFDRSSPFEDLLPPVKGRRFQSTYPYGMRLGKDRAVAVGAVVSIHASERDATAAMRPSRLGSSMFQSTHLYEMRRSLMASRSRGDMFQSTHPYGMRRAGSPNWAAERWSFNP